MIPFLWDQSLNGENKKHEKTWPITGFKVKTN